MSALTHGVKTKMFGFLKNLFRKPAPSNGSETAHSEAVSDMEHSTPVTNGGPKAPARLRTHSNGSGVQLPLQSIIKTLPLDLRAKVKQADVGEVIISVPLEKVLAQLATGSVKISYGELRRTVPEVFSADSTADKTLVALPLNEILARLNPALLIRRADQKQVEVPEEISSPFDNYGQGLVFSVGNPASITSPPTPPAAPPRKVTPATELVRKAAAEPALPGAAPVRDFITSIPAPNLPSIPAHNLPPQPPAQLKTPTPTIQSPVAKEAKSGNQDTFSIPTVPAPTQPAPSARSNAHKSHPGSNGGASTPQPPATPPTPIHSAKAQDGGAKVQESEAKTVDSPEAELKTGDAGSKSQENFSVALSALAEGWPEAVRQEIVQMNLADAKVALPADLVEQALKRGRVTFTWKVLRSWIRPVPTMAVSMHDGALLELPLKVIAPLFVTRQKEGAKSQQRVQLDENIPNLFFGFPQSEGTVPAAPGHTKPVDTNYYVWNDAADSAQVDETEFKRNPVAGGTDFISKCATPNEVVSRAAALEGVAGALIALPDGLMVASRLQPDLNGDTIAAFLPQIFGKVSQCTKELRMGELNNLNFTVGNVPWKIFRVNAIFFAAFGQPGAPLPTAQLAALAAELDHKNR